MLMHLYGAALVVILTMHSCLKFMWIDFGTYFKLDNTICICARKFKLSHISDLAEIKPYISTRYQHETVFSVIKFTFFFGDKQNFISCWFTSSTVFFWSDITYKIHLDCGKKFDARVIHYNGDYRDRQADELTSQRTIESEKDVEKKVNWKLNVFLFA